MNHGRIAIDGRRILAIIIIALLSILVIKGRGESKLLAAFMIGITSIYLIIEKDRYYLESISILLLYVAIYELFKDYINSMEFSIAMQLSIIFLLYIIYIIIKYLWKTGHLGHNSFQTL